ncbi:MAG: ribosomal protein [Clostridia bacterium]|nr:ribosomal protein [Clostridia bacterium]
MPSEKVLQEKKQIVDELIAKLKKSSAGVLVDYKGINVKDDTALRKELRKNNVEYMVVKNTLTRFALKEIGYGDIESVLNGTTALAISESDLVAPAKVLCKYAKDHEKFKIKAGFAEGKTMNVQEVQFLAELPPKEVLIAKVLYGFNAPLTGFVNVLNGNLRGLAVALKAIADKKAGEGAGA